MPRTINRRKGKRYAVRRTAHDPLLLTQPDKIYAVFSPIESVLSRIDIDGTVETAGRQVVFKEGKDWYDLPAALRGIVEFHNLAETKHGIPADTAAMERFAAKLDSGSPVFEQDLEAVHACIASCKRQAMQLRVSQAQSIINTVSISAEWDRNNVRANREPTR